MASQLTPDERAAILADIQAGELSRNAIARKHKRGAATITDIAKTAGLTDAFDRSDTETATRARAADMKARRAVLAADLLDDVDRLRKRAWAEYEYYERTREDVVRVTLDLPPLGEARNAYTAIGISIDKHLALVRSDTDAGADAARSMLGQVAQGLNAAYEQLMQEDATPSDDGG